MFALFVIFLYLCIITLSHIITTRLWKSKHDNESYVCLRGKTAIVTGANSGIGYYTALGLAARGARVIMACRDFTKGNAAKKHIINETQNTDVVLKRLDLSCLKSVREFCQTISNYESQIDILVNNAGAIQLGDHVTSDKLQITWQVNYFAPFLLTNLLLDKLQASNGRIINVTGCFCGKHASLNDLHSYWNPKYVMISDLIAYFHAKTAFYDFSTQLSRRLNGKCKVYTYEANLNGSSFWRRIYLGPIAFVYLGLNLLFPSTEQEARDLVNILLGNQLINRNEGSLCISSELWKRTCQFVELNDT